MDDPSPLSGLVRLGSCLDARGCGGAVEGVCGELHWFSQALSSFLQGDSSYFEKDYDSGTDSPSSPTNRTPIEQKVNNMSHMASSVKRDRQVVAWLRARRAAVLDQSELREDLTREAPDCRAAAVVAGGEGGRALSG